MNRLELRQQLSPNARLNVDIDELSDGLLERCTCVVPQLNRVVGAVCGNCSGFSLVPAGYQDILMEYGLPKARVICSTCGWKGVYDLSPCHDAEADKVPEADPARSAPGL